MRHVGQATNMGGNKRFSLAVVGRLTNNYLTNANDII